MTQKYLFTGTIPVNGGVCDHPGIEFGGFVVGGARFRSNLTGSQPGYVYCE